MEIVISLLILLLVVVIAVWIINATLPDSVKPVATLVIGVLALIYLLSTLLHVMPLHFR